MTKKSKASQKQAQVSAKSAVKSKRAKASKAKALPGTSRGSRLAPPAALAPTSFSATVRQVSQDRISLVPADPVAHPGTFVAFKDSLHISGGTWSGLTRGTSVQVQQLLPPNKRGVYV